MHIAVARRDPVLQPEAFRPLQRKPARPMGPPHPEIPAVRSSSAAVEEYASLGYGALSHALVDYWMAKMSGGEVKLAVLFIRHTIGEVDKRIQGDMNIAISLNEMTERAGVDRESAVRAIRELEKKGIVSAQRAHRTTTVYTLDLRALWGPWVGKTDSTDEVRVGETDSI